MTKIIALNAFEDNYIWVVYAQNNSSIFVVDPGEAEPVLSYIKKYNLKLEGILLTHHHPDHSGGISELIEAYPDIPVYSSKKDKVPGVTHMIQEGENIHLSNFNDPIHVLEIPGHTLGHVAYLYQDAAFTGDTLFSVGCGKIFEGTAAQMYDSLNKLKKLPAHTLIYCGHEYTLANIAFAQKVDPNNELLAQRKEEAERCQAQQVPSLPASLALELKINPFLQCDNPDALLKLRTWKNTF